MRRLVLIDGEHYPDVTTWAIEMLGGVCCVVFLGGSEKIGSVGEIKARLGIPFYTATDYSEALTRALQENDVDEVVDLSDEPVLTYEDRFKIATLCMLYGVAYRGADFEFKPKPLKRTRKPSLAVIGTGKRVGKTAIGGFVARVLRKIANPVVVTMSRGGPEKPEIIRRRARITPEFLLELAGSGRHAASDHIEDALTARVTTIGCRRCGGGMAGFPFFDVIDEGVKLAESLPNDLVIFEGSGATFPAYRADGYILVVGALQRIDFLRGYFGPFRLSLADIVVVTMANLADERKRAELLETIGRINPSADIHLTAFRPRPLGDVSGKRLGLVMTSGRAVERAKDGIEALGAEVAAVSGNLSNRPALLRDLRRFTSLDAVAVELKAAAVDVVTRWALEKDLEVIYLDNEPMNIDGKDLHTAVLKLGKSVLGGGR